MTILITRPAPEAAVFAEMCMTRGYETIVSPLMEIRILASKVDLSGVGALAFHFGQWGSRLCSKQR